MASTTMAVSISGTSTVLFSNAHTIFSIVLTPHATGDRAFLRLHDNATGSAAGTSVMLQTGSGALNNVSVGMNLQGVRFQNGIYIHVTGAPASVMVEVG